MDKDRSVMDNRIEQMEMSSKYYYETTSTAPSIGGRWKVGTVIAFLVAVAALIIGVMSYTNTLQLQSITDDLTSESPLEIKYPASCSQIGRNAESGLYIIRPNPSMLAFPVYCDMHTDGGGWTLVASVHENNIDGKCTLGDKWSSEVGSSPAKKGLQNWQNFNIFGRVEEVTSGDYKNPAYFSEDASNIMLWHVPNGQRLTQISNTAFLKYYSNNSFLDSYGGNLRDLFRTFPFDVSEEANGMLSFLKEVNATVRSVLNEVPDWHLFVYQGQYSIHDGGNDLYDIGNKVYFRFSSTDIENEDYTILRYNAPYASLLSDVYIQSSATYPFITAAWVGEGQPGFKINAFEYRVVSEFGADGQGRVTIHDLQNVYYGNMRARFTAFNVHGAGDASLSEVYFYIGSEELWNSTFPTHIHRINWPSTTDEARNIVRFQGSMSNLLLGFSMFSRTDGKLVTPLMIGNVLKRYMRIAENIEFQRRFKSLEVPVNYAVGSDELIRQKTPRDVKVDPGFIQFGAVNLRTTFNTICPGVRVLSNNADRVCIGGKNSAKYDLNSCGDFSGWNGAVGDPGNKTQPSETGRSQDDIQSSILIFTR